MVAITLYFCQFVLKDKAWTQPRLRTLSHGGSFYHPTICISCEDTWGTTKQVEEDAIFVQGVTMPLAKRFLHDKGFISTLIQMSLWVGLRVTYPSADDDFIVEHIWLMIFDDGFF